MSAEPVTFVEKSLAARRRRYLPLRVLALLIVLAVIAAIVIAVVLGIGMIGASRATFKDNEQHFLHGSIGAEQSSGIPYQVWQALPVLFPEDFEGRQDYQAFGFLYQESAHGNDDLPIGIARSPQLGIELVWFNCAVCHAGTYRLEEGGERHLVPGMPSNNLDIFRFTAFIVKAAASDRLAAEPLFAAMKRTGNGLNGLDRLFWRMFVVPRMREELLRVRSAMLPLMQRQPAWGPGRVDTFNPYKVLEFGMPGEELTDSEVVGASDFPSIFLQGPREGMDLHWDGNNPSLNERNLSAALGAGVTPDTVDHAGVEKIAAWLYDLTPPPSPFAPDAEAVKRGEGYYNENCLTCHGYQGEQGYVFAGEGIERLGYVEEIEDIQTDRRRLDSYTPEFNRRQLTELFAGTRYQFKQFRKTNGYSNMPLDGLWLRGPYLHNGSVPTLKALLDDPSDRPSAYLRGSDVVDAENGGFLSPACTPGEPVEGGFCFDTSQPGNANTGHVYGTDLSPEAKADLLAYLLTF